MPEVVNTFEPHRERARNRTMSRVEVVNRKTRNLVLPDGNVVEPGTSEVLVYEDNVKVIEAQVERDPDAVKEAERRFELRIAEQVQEKLGPPYTQRTAENMAEFLKGGRGTQDERVPQAHKEILARTGSSVEGEFRATMRRDILPLDSCKVIEANIPEPQRRLQVEESTRQASILANALREAGMVGNPAQQGQQNQNRKQ